MYKQKEFVRQGHENCPNPDCGSSSAWTEYSDGSHKCWKCNHWSSGKKYQSTKPKYTKEMISGFIKDGEVLALPQRKLDKDTISKWGMSFKEVYLPSIRKESLCSIFNIYNKDKELIGQKFKYKTPTNKKDFFSIGTKPYLYGEWLWSKGGRQIIITEGEEDAMSVNQALGDEWPVVSLSDGVGSLQKLIKNKLDYLNSFGKVVIAFDMDKVGREAATKLAKAITPGKGFIVDIREKDMNDLLIKEGPLAVKKAILNAKPYSPEKVFVGNELDFDSMFQTEEEVYPTLYPDLNEKLGGGLKLGKLYLIASTTGAGKSTFIREVSAHLMFKQKVTVGSIFLENSKEEVILYYLSIAHNKPVDEILKTWSPDKIREEAKKLLNTEHFVFEDHYGSKSGEDLFSNIRHMIIGCGCKFIILDNITVGLCDSSVRERGQAGWEASESLVSRLAQLTAETGASIFILAHVNKAAAEKKDRNGDIVKNQFTGSDIRGGYLVSGASDYTILLYDIGINLRKIVVDKNRTGGDMYKGDSDVVSYNCITGRMLPSGIDLDLRKGD